MTHTPTGVGSEGSVRALVAFAALCLASLICTACAGTSREPTVASVPTPPPLAHSLIPVPSFVQLTPADSFAVDSTTAILVDPDATAETERVAQVLADLIAIPSAPRPRRLAARETPAAGSIHLRLAPHDTTLAAEGYQLTIARDRVMLVARQPAGLLYGAQTLRQLLPTIVEYPAAEHRTLKLLPGPRLRCIVGECIVGVMRARNSPLDNREPPACRNRGSICRSNHRMQRQQIRPPRHTRSPVGKRS